MVGVPMPQQGTAFIFVMESKNAIEYIGKAILTMKEKKMNKKEIIYPSMVIRNQAEALELLKKEKEQLKENNQAMQEEMARTWEKCDKLQNNWNELKELLKQPVPTYASAIKLLDEIEKIIESRKQ